jgi:hypothetical protein
LALVETSPERLLVPDSRGNDRYLRVTWHPQSRTLVISHWVGDVCSASTRLELADASKLIGLIVAALEDSVSRSAAQVAAMASGPSQAAAVAATAPKAAVVARAVNETVSRLARALRPRFAQVVELSGRLRGDDAGTSSGGRGVSGTG